MVSDSELVHRLREVLRTSDLNTATATGVRRTLEAECGVDLSDRKAFIRDQIDSFLQSIVGANTDHDGVDDNAEDEIDEEGPETAKPEEDNGDCGSEENGFDQYEEEEEEEEVKESDGKRRMNGKRPNMVDNVVEKKGGFSKPCGLSPQLQKFLGVPELARPEVVKKIWAYIREKNLQDPKDKRKILCDEALRPLFRGNAIGMFQMNKALSKHIWPLNEEEVPVDASQKEKQRKQVPVKSSQKERQRKRGREGSNKRPVKRHKGQGSGFLAPLPLSDALVQFIGTGENELSRNDVTKRTWEYIKQNNLQDPSDKRRIICDKKLKELVEVDSFTGLTLPRLLTVHFIKVEQ